MWSWWIGCTFSERGLDYYRSKDNNRGAKAYIGHKNVKRF